MGHNKLLYDKRSAKVRFSKTDYPRKANREKNSQQKKSLMECITKLQEEQAVSSKQVMALKKKAVSLRNQATKDLPWILFSWSWVFSESPASPPQQFRIFGIYGILLPSPLKSAVNIAAEDPAAMVVPAKFE
jgi:hypothetical protein